MMQTVGGRHSAERRFGSFLDEGTLLESRVAFLMREIEAFKAERGNDPAREARARLASPYFAKPRKMA